MTDRPTPSVCNSCCFNRHWECKGKRKCSCIKCYPSNSDQPAAPPTPTLSERMEAFIASQQDLPADAAKILRDNLWKLYDESPVAAPPTPEPTLLTNGEALLIEAARQDIVTTFWMSDVGTDSAGFDDAVRGILQQFSNGIKQLQAKAMEDEANQEAERVTRSYSATQERT